jgi:hypothetical protein
MPPARHAGAARLLALTAGLALAAAAPAQADWFVAPFVGLKFAGRTNLVDLEQGAGNTKAALGVTAGFLGDGLFGVETDITHYPRFFERSGANLVARSHVFTLMGNVTVAAPRDLTGYALRPFVSGGAGWMDVGIDDVADIFDVSSNLFGVNVGGGAVGGLTARTSVRFDLRYFKSVTTDDEERVGFGSARLSFWRAGVGLTIR